MTAFNPDYSTPPGMTILETCQAKGFTTAELARRMGIPNSYMQMIVHGTCPLTGDVAEKLGEHLEVPREFWEALEKQHQKRKVKISARTQQGVVRDALLHGAVLGFSAGAILVNIIWFWFRFTRQ